MRPWTICIFLSVLLICSSCGFGARTSDQFQGSFTALPATTSPTVTRTLMPSITSIVAPTKLATLENDKTYETIIRLLQEPMDCLAPCFWGITPGKTTSNGARDIFGHFGIPITVITYENTDYYNVDYNLDDDLELAVILPIQNGVVETINIKMEIFPKETGVPRKWGAYSPETLIHRYGKPSRVDFITDWGPSPFFAMQVYFDKEDLIVQYSGQKVIPAEKGTSQVCPLIAEFDNIWIWMGKNPLYPPGEGISVEEVTSITLDEFSKLMIGDPQRACFSFYGGAFP